MAEKQTNPIDAETKNLRKLYNRRLTLRGKIRKAEAVLEPARKELAAVEADIDKIENPKNEGNTAHGSGDDPDIVEVTRE